MKVIEDRLNRVYTLLEPLPEDPNALVRVRWTRFDPDIKRDVTVDVFVFRWRIRPYSP